MREWPDRLAQFLQRQMAEHNISHWTAQSRFSREGKPARLEFAVEDPGVIDFCKIVVFGCEPKHRNRRNAVGRELMS